MRGVSRFPVPKYQNSGCGAIAYSVSMGARRVGLIGFDCQASGGQVHHHGDHPPQLGNAKTIGQWMPRFVKLAADMKRANAEVINASRKTALSCFPRMNLEALLDHWNHPRSE